LLAAGLSVAAGVCLISVGIDVDPLLLHAQDVRQATGVPVIGELLIGRGRTAESQPLGAAWERFLWIAMGAGALVACVVLLVR
jgi:hypothetical protein